MGKNKKKRKITIKSPSTKKKSKIKIKIKTKKSARRKNNIKIKKTILETLSSAREQFKKRLAYNKDITLTSKDPVQQTFLDFYYKDTIKTDKMLRSRMSKLINLAKSNNYGRISKKVMARFVDAFYVSGHLDKYGFIVSDKETAFKNMILVVLRDNGVDITNPSELNKALSGMDMSTIYRVWKDKHKDDEDTFYEQFSHNPLQFLRNIKQEVRSHKKYQKWQASKAKKLLNNLSKYE